MNDKDLEIQNLREIKANLETEIKGLKVQMRALQDSINELLTTYIPLLEKFQEYLEYEFNFTSNINHAKIFVKELWTKYLKN